ncbi:MAG: anhydro-N-acetylmuramic acid kinase [Burkholderiales bacterium]|nr:anhydro-N-acetylmuramic acid kinase [Burkholderiales bacterium]MDE2396013.1 anhydro-N-acetylmuramic acid kinase [Burkholderiales bacterium]MDE2457336.1 anhydro-N-acetylmuramic acid kinase [Burkholderiales bacterium]
MALFIGLMSGTSLDGVDAVLAEIDAAGLSTLGHCHHPFAPTLGAELAALNQPGDNELQRAALAANSLARAYAEVATELLAGAGRQAKEVCAIGAHGQTVRHRPGEFDATGFTIQLLNGALLAECSGIDVVCDFRARDVAAGGQGAPLVPAFHAQRFARVGQDVAALNLGGIANLTLLGADGSVRGFDCGPGNGLMDLWCQRWQGRPYDEDGRWAASGRVDPGLLGALLAEPFFERAPPKSTGRDLFNAEWLGARLAGSTAPPADVMATLAELTARGAADALLHQAAASSALVVCGGGAFNGHLMTRLAALLPGVEVRSSADSGVAPDQVEALAFAWLAWNFVERRPVGLPAVTGARGARILGCLYPA